ncbi:MAG: fused MFS/spermidine synthase [Candidatus Adiutrix sp.]|jgi:spermidine synthase|nr:fused MFS/spermidine synthase [Candidatus Adiutrix sp.]
MTSGFWSKLLEAFKDEARDYDPTVIFEGDSPYHHITIREENGRRTLYFGPNGEEAETSINPAHPEEPVFEYPGMMLAALPLHPTGRRIAMLGLGGGFIPGLFRAHLPQYSLTVVEVDPLVAELAQTYFGFVPEGNVELVVSDGREFMEAQPEESLDQIWLDAFSGNNVPARLSGIDFLDLCYSRLTPGGLLAQNLHQSSPVTFRDQLYTTRAVFGEFLAFDGQRCGNAVVIAKTRGGPPGPAWKKPDLTAAAKKFGPRIGPYDLVAEMKKIKVF